MNVDELPDDVIENVEKEEKVETSKKSKTEKKKSNNNIERWWASSGATHSVVVKRRKTQVKPETISFRNFIFECDLDTEEGQCISNDLRKSGAWGTSLHIVVDRNLSKDEGRRAHSIFKNCIGNIVDKYPVGGLKHVRAILTKEECDKYGVDAINPAKHDLLQVLYENKSFEPVV